MKDISYHHRQLEPPGHNVCLPASLGAKTWININGLGHLQTSAAVLSVGDGYYLAHHTDCLPITGQFDKDIGMSDWKHVEEGE